MAFNKHRRKQPHLPRPRCGAVVPAAGQATRMAGQDKVLYELNGVPLIIHTLLALDKCPDINDIVVVARPDDIVLLGGLCRQYDITKIRQVVCGGPTRTHSVLNGLMALSLETELAAIHDAARPLVSPQLISNTILLAAQTGAAAPAVRPKDTVKKISGTQVESTVPRDTVRLIQTPQVFNAGLIKGALVRAIRENWEITDDCSAVERMGMSVSLTEGSYENFKVTTPEDLIFAEALMERKQV